MSSRLNGTLVIQYNDETNFYTSVLPVDGKSSQS